MAKSGDVYKCNVCGHVITVLHEGSGELVCCNQPMQEMKPNTEDAAEEKHVPVIEEMDKGYVVKIGSAPHPMEDGHYIEWIELVIDGKGCYVYLKPGDEPKASFEGKGSDVSATAYCNLHGLWKSA